MELVKLGAAALAFALPLVAWRWRRPPSTNFLLACLAVAGVSGALVVAFADAIRANHGSWAALLPLIGIMVACVFGAAFLVAGGVELVRLVARSVSGRRSHR